ncbi:MAG: T9SS type A sorting domain-containing protein [Bacteroidota bacterium]
MKKTLLFLFVFSFVIHSSAQQNKYRIAAKETKRFKDYSYADMPVPSMGPVKPQSSFASGSKWMNKIPIASSSNLYSVIASNATCLSAIPSQNIVLFISRGGGSFGWTGNDIIATWSDDNFITSHRFKLLTLTDSTHLSRFPAGTLFMPTTGTVPTDGFAVYSGMAMDSSGNWNHDFFGSSKLDSTYKDVNYFALDSPARHEFPRVQFTSCEDGTVHVLADGGQNLNSPYTNLSLWNGVFNAANKNYDWNLRNFPLHVKETAAEGDMVVSWDMAWSTSGDTGYVYAFGIDSLNNPHDDVIPLVYRTIDHGNTWTYLPPFDFYTIPSVKNKLDDWWQANIGNVDRPRVFFSSSSGSDAVVDINGNLHIATLMQCGYTKNQDSLLYNFLYEPRMIWDVFTTPTGWNAVIIDTILTLPVDSANGLSPGIGWDHRLQVSKTTLNHRLIFAWTDSDTSFFDNVLAPDIYLRCRDVNSGVIYQKYSVTQGTTYDQANYWMYLSDVTFEDVCWYRLHASTTTHSTSALSPCTQYYFRIDIPKCTGIEEKNNASISFNCFPNPFHQTTTINFTLEKASPLSIEITDILGKQMMKTDKGILPEGSHNITVDCSGFSPGVYLYTVKAGELMGTGKMIIE